MLSWDNYDEPLDAELPKVVAEPAKSATVNEPIQEAETPAEPTLQKSAAPVETATTSVASNDPIAKAKQSIQEIDIAPGLEELEMGGARIQVDQIGQMPICATSATSRCPPPRNKSS